METGEMTFLLPNLVLKERGEESIPLGFPMTRGTVDHSFFLQSRDIGLLEKKKDTLRMRALRKMKQYPLMEQGPREMERVGSRTRVDSEPVSILLLGGYPLRTVRSSWNIDSFIIM